MSLLDKTATELIAGMEAGELFATDVCEAHLQQIEAHDSAIQAFLSVDKSAAMQTAAAIDHRRQNGLPLGKLAGIPIAIKDNMCAAGGVTSCGSRMLSDFIPPYDATVVERLKAADAVLIGRTNLDEFAMGGSSENSSRFPTRNPWDSSRVPGGSSGGSAASVAARMAPLSLGSDTGGSIRQPASFCGVVGLKPSYGRVSRYGLVAFASSLDQIGPFARSAEDTALLLEAIAGHDPRDETSASLDVPEYSRHVREPLSGLKLGVPREYFEEGLDSSVESAIRAALQVYEQQGAKLVDISLPHSEFGIATYYLIAPSEASSNLARYDGAHYGYRNEDGNDLEGDGPLVTMYRSTRSSGFGPEVKRRIMLGTYALSAGYYDAYYLKAMKVRRLIRQDFDKAFEEVDFVVGPVAPTTAFPLGDRVDDPLAMYLCDLYTVAANLAGIAAISLPCGFAEGLPVGLQLQARPFDELRLLQAAHMFQQATDWHQRTAELSG